MCSSPNLTSAAAKISPFRLAGLLIPILALLLMVSVSTPSRADTCEGGCWYKIDVDYSVVITPPPGPTFEFFEISIPWLKIEPSKVWTVTGDTITGPLTLYSSGNSDPSLDWDWVIVHSWAGKHGTIDIWGWSILGEDPFLDDTWLVVSNGNGVTWDYYDDGIAGEEYICPNPEPGTLLLLGTGLLGLAGIARRKLTHG